MGAVALPLTPNPSPPHGKGDAAAELLAFLRAAGFEVTGTADRVFVTPRNRLSPAEVSQIVNLKPGLVKLLAAERWERCQSCLGWVDADLACDLPEASCQPKCPYRRKPK